MKKAGIFILLLFISSLVSAQVTKFELGVNGLTCSQCSRNVEMSLRKLSFVKDVKMNLEHTEGEIFVKDNIDVDAQRIAKAVTDAGFSVRYLKGSYSLSGISVSEGCCVTVFGKKYVFTGAGSRVLNGSVTLQFLGDRYMGKKDAHNWKPRLKNGCGEAQPYYVTLVK